MSILFGPAALKIVRGATWSDNITMTDLSTGLPVNLTGVVSIIMRVRPTYDGILLLEASTTAGSILIVNATGGIIGIRVGSAITNSAFPANNYRKAKYVYDVLIQRTAGEYEPAIKGKLTVYPSVTQAIGP